MMFPIDKFENILPADGEVYYYGRVFNKSNADEYFATILKNIDWRNDETLIFGKRIITKRKVAWYADKPFEYTYSKVTRKALLWTKELLELKTQIENLSGETFNSCLLNLYHSGEEGMGWHSDDEPDLLKNGAIASISLGAERRFVFKHKNSAQKVELLLAHGSLLLMKGATQKYWLHTVPTSKRVAEPRINLTFRTIIVK